jgi:hypothetical protein
VASMIAGDDDRFWVRERADTATWWSMLGSRVDGLVSNGAAGPRVVGFVGRVDQYEQHLDRRWQAAGATRRRGQPLAARSVAGVDLTNP